MRHLLAVSRPCDNIQMFKVELIIIDENLF